MPLDEDAVFGVVTQSVRDARQRLFVFGLQRGCAALKGNGLDLQRADFLQTRPALVVEIAERLLQRLGQIALVLARLRAKQVGNEVAVGEPRRIAVRQRITIEITGRDKNLSGAVDGI